ncbi:microsomal triglyceride transfer protein-like [Paramacrobiotus metropolitanus]|uniref:microsomal triglyceride transfer protein-like n=1 Tax=Paramacrobiotus metropolitanus TaxID=2943436 RepID=UPI002445E7DE|nr:microsomal triglyceride transfer protein-like [Paramacrobiotus metropolitanus]
MELSAIWFVVVISVLIHDAGCIDTKSSAVYEYQRSTVLSGSQPVEQAGTVIVSPLWLASKTTPQPANSPYSGLFHVQFRRESDLDEELIERPFLIAIGNPDVLHFHSKETVRVKNFKRAVYRILSVYSKSTLNGTGDNFSNFTCRLLTAQQTDNTAIRATEYTSQQACRRPLRLTSASGRSHSPLDYATLSVNYQRRHTSAANGTFLNGQITEHHKLFLPHAAAANGVLQAESVQSVRLIKVEPNYVGKFAAPSISTAMGNFPGFVQEGINFVKDEHVGVSLTKTVNEPVGDLLKKLKKHTLKSNAATVNAGRAFLRLLTSAGAASEEDVVVLLKESLAIKKKDKANIYFILDVLAASQSLAGFEAVETTLFSKKSSSNNLDYFYRYVTALSFARRPKVTIGQKLLNLLEQKDVDSKLAEAAALAVAALSRTMSRENSGNDGDQLEFVDKVSSLLSERLTTAKDADTQVLYLRALGNLAGTEQLPQIISHIHKGGVAAAAAIRATQRYDWSDLSWKIKSLVESAVWGVYESTHKTVTSSSKIAAVDWLIHRYAADDKQAAYVVLRIVRGLAAIHGEECRTYILARLRNHLGLSTHFWSALSVALRSTSTYADLAEMGQSTAYHGLLRAAPALNATYDLGMEFAGGSMKESAVKVGVASGDQHLGVISFGLYAHGLASFMGGAEATEDGDSPVTAGLVLEMAEVTLPRMVFFNGLGQLTSLALSASGDDPVAEMQFNLLLQNVSVAVPLGNGMTVVTRLQTTIAADLSGFVEASLWYRTLKSLVRNRVAFVLEAESRLVDRAVTKDVSVVLREASQGKMDFMTSIDFSSFPVKLCMQMSSGLIKHSRHQRWTDKDNKPRIKSHKRTVPPKSYAFGWRNANTCRKLQPT